MAISLASAFPQSTIVGVDLDPFSIARAEGVAASLSLPNLRFVCVSVRHHLLPTPLRLSEPLASALSVPLPTPC